MPNCGSQQGSTACQALQGSSTAQLCTARSRLCNRLKRLSLLADVSSVPPHLQPVVASLTNLYRVRVWGSLHRCCRHCLATVHSSVASWEAFARDAHADLPQPRIAPSMHARQRRVRIPARSAGLVSLQAL